MKKGMNWLILALMVFLPAARAYAVLPPSDGSELSKIVHNKAGATLEVVIGVRGWFNSDFVKLSNPERLVIDMSPIDTISASPSIELNAGGVLSVSAEKYQSRIARLVFYLESGAVLFRCERSEEGLKIIFRKKDGDGRLPGETSAVEDARRIERPETRPADGNSDGGYFIKASGGVGLFLKSPSTFDRTFPLYGEEGTSKEDYKMKMDYPSALSLGKLTTLGNIPVKIGFTGEYWDFKSESEFTFVIPHPILPDSPRTVTLSDDSRSYYTSLLAFALFRVAGNNRMTLYFGPELGYAFGKFRMLEDIDMEDRSPFSAADVAVTSTTYIKHSVSGLRAGALAELEYSLSKKLSLILDVKAFLMSPKIADLDKNINLSQAEAMIGLCYNFK